MARRSIVTVMSDVSGEAAQETVRLQVDDRTYEIDLTQSEADDLRAPPPPLHRGRTAHDQRRKSHATHQGRGGETTIRAWARSAGIEVAARGRIPKQVRDQFEAAQRDGRTAEVDHRVAVGRLGPALVVRARARGFGTLTHGTALH